MRNRKLKQFIKQSYLAIPVPDSPLSDESYNALWQQQPASPSKALPVRAIAVAAAMVMVVGVLVTAVLQLGPLGLQGLWTSPGATVTTPPLTTTTQPSQQLKIKQLPGTAPDMDYDEIFPAYDSHGVYKDYKEDPSNPGFSVGAYYIKEGGREKELQPAHFVKRTFEFGSDYGKAHTFSIEFGYRIYEGQLLLWNNTKEIPDDYLVFYQTVPGNTEVIIMAFTERLVYHTFWFYDLESGEMTEILTGRSLSMDLSPDWSQVLVCETDKSATPAVVVADIRTKERVDLTQKILRYLPNEDWISGFAFRDANHIDCIAYGMYDDKGQPLATDKWKWIRYIYNFRDDSIVTLYEPTTGVRYLYDTQKIGIAAFHKTLFADVFIIDGIFYYLNPQTRERVEIEGFQQDRLNLFFRTTPDGSKIIVSTLRNDTDMNLSERIVLAVIDLVNYTWQPTEHWNRSSSTS